MRNKFCFKHLVCTGLLLGAVFVARVPADVPPRFSISPLSAQMQRQLITAGVWQPGCPVGLDDLRLLSVSYYDFTGIPHRDGAIILNKAVASAALNIFTTLYADKFPFAAINPLVQAQANWRLAEQRNTTYGFICMKNAAGKFSKESYGTVITLNPVQNPEISFTDGQTKKINLSTWWCKIRYPILPCEAVETIPRVAVFPPAGILSINRALKLQGMAETAVSTFARYGFTVWGGQSTQAINWKKFSFSAGGTPP